MRSEPDQDATAHLLSCAQEWPSTALQTTDSILHTPCDGSLSCWIPGLPVHCHHCPAASAGFRRKLCWPQKQGPASQVGSILGQRNLSHLHAFSEIMRIRNAFLDYAGQLRGRAQMHLSVSPMLGKLHPGACLAAHRPLQPWRCISWLTS